MRILETFLAVITGGAKVWCVSGTPVVCYWW